MPIEFSTSVCQSDGSEVVIGHFVAENLKSAHSHAEEISSGNRIAVIGQNLASTEPTNKVFNVLAFNGAVITTNLTDASFE